MNRPEELSGSLLHVYADVTLNNHWIYDVIIQEICSDMKTE